MVANSRGPPAGGAPVPAGRMRPGVARATLAHHPGLRQLLAVMHPAVLGEVFGRASASPAFAACPAGRGSPSAAPGESSPRCCCTRHSSRLALALGLLLGLALRLLLGLALALGLFLGLALRRRHRRMMRLWWSLCSIHSKPADKGGLRLRLRIRRRKKKASKACVPAAA